MSSDAQNVLSNFQGLPEGEQRLVAAEILRQSAQWDNEPLSDEDLARAADDVFQELDRREASHGR